MTYTVKGVLSGMHGQRCFKWYTRRVLLWRGSGALDLMSLSQVTVFKMPMSQYVVGQSSFYHMPNEKEMEMSYVLQ